MTTIVRSFLTVSVLMLGACGSSLNAPSAPGTEALPTTPEVQPPTAAAPTVTNPASTVTAPSTPTVAAPAAPAAPAMPAPTVPKP